jgi:hypothetical protein
LTLPLPSLGAGAARCNLSARNCRPNSRSCTSLPSASDHSPGLSAYASQNTQR